MAIYDNICIINSHHKLFALYQKGKYKNIFKKLKCDKTGLEFFANDCPSRGNNHKVNIITSLLNC